MSRRQALGVLSTNSCTNQLANAHQLATKQAFGKHATTKAYGAENQQQSFAPPAVLIAAAATTSSSTVISSVKPMTKVTAADLEFDIFQEELVPDVKNAHGAPNGMDDKAMSLDKENEKLLILEEDEDYYDEDEEEDDDEDDEEEEEDEEKDLDDDQEEGISRLNMAVMTDTLTSEEATSCRDTSMATMMDSSSFHHDLSPMILDDTIKFQSRLSVSHDAQHDDGHNDDDDEEAEYEDEEEEEVDADEEANANEICEEEMQRQKMLHEAEEMLMSCLDYKDDILAYMREAELSNRPKSNYMSKQQDINSSMRTILVDWLVEVCEEYRLNAETLYNAVNYTDRFLSNMSVLRGKLQLVGTASMYVASKYEEITPPDVAEFVYITDDTYTKKQVLRMEHLLLKVLDFKMTTPTINAFLTHYLRFIRASHGSARVDCLAKYLAELTLIDADTFLGYLPSQIAASAVYLALVGAGKSWTKQTAETLGYSYDLSELKSCIADMYKSMQQAPTNPQQAIFEKYKQPKYEQVALITLSRSSLAASIFQ